MKDRQLFYQPNICTGCKQCMMACSLLSGGTCGVEDSLIRVLVHPEFGFAQVIVSDQCQYTDCQGGCVSICSLNVLKLAKASEWSRLIQDETWEPVPVFHNERF